MSELLFLGIDGGQSSTEALIGDAEGHVLGRGVAGPCNHVSGPEAIGKFRNAMTGAIESACAEAGISFAEMTFAGACLGLSGGPDDKAEHIRDIVRSKHYKITNDAVIALTGALAGEPGIVVIAGTGSIAYGRNANGREARAGGWGYVFGDEGGAFDITRRALRAALRMEEGWGAATVLRDRLLAEFGATSANELLHWFYTPEFPRSRVARFARQVDEAAGGGDAVAHSVLREAAGALAGYVGGVKQNLFEDTGASVSYVGGVFDSVPLLAAFRSAVEEQWGCLVQTPACSAAEGALLEAVRIARTAAG